MNIWNECVGKLMSVAPCAGVRRTGGCNSWNAFILIIPDLPANNFPFPGQNATLPDKNNCQHLGAGRPTGT